MTNLPLAIVRRPANNPTSIPSAEELIALIQEGYRDYMHHQADSKSSGAQE